MKKKKKKRIKELPGDPTPATAETFVVAAAAVVATVERRLIPTCHAFLRTDPNLLLSELVVMPLELVPAVVDGDAGVEEEEDDEGEEEEEEEEEDIVADEGDVEAADEAEDDDDTEVDDVEVGREADRGERGGEDDDGLVEGEDDGFELSDTGGGGGSTGMGTGGRRWTRLQAVLTSHRV
jgi:hypothetical protein